MNLLHHFYSTIRVWPSLLPFAAAAVSPVGKGEKCRAMNLLHHFYSTIGVRPSLLLLVALDFF